MVAAYLNSAVVYVDIVIEGGSVGLHSKLEVYGVTDCGSLLQTGGKGGIGKELGVGEALVVCGVSLLAPPYA